MAEKRDWVVELRDLCSLVLKDTKELEMRKSDLLAEINSLILRTKAAGEDLAKVKAAQESIKEAVQQEKARQIQEIEAKSKEVSELEVILRERLSKSAEREGALNKELAQLEMDKREVAADKDRYVALRDEYNEKVEKVRSVLNV